MKQKEGIVIYENLYSTYKNLGLPVDTISESKDFTINDLARIHREFPFRSSVFRPSYFSFVFVKNAHGKYTTDDLTFDTVPGTIYFTNPGHHKAFEWFDMKELYLITLSESFLKENVHPEIFEEFPFLLAETVRPRTLDPDTFAEFEKLYLQIDKEYQGTSPYRTRIIGNLFVVILLKIKAYFWSDYNPIYEGNRSSQIVKTFKENLEKHFRDLADGREQSLFQVQDYARLQSLNANYLSNVIKSKTGKSISAWIADKTIAEAKSLLKNSAISIKQVAFQLGFSESNHFSNYFKKHTNLTPNAFRKG
ncbi:AraC family transcriptional regulator [Fulvivirgaceae bacterium PWU4]|uniref:AraC family transcriptional regulator n=1 Tax=Chryseosolibacter histidini TaxID=2782349 RepID=A0AAP2DN12_9BACT|nr:helix-turn-helix domain-containing protein [Chryseosolibacter histidini]MBT1698102.1 AraC family transcriptional regulator [Chryseosolibacter histidini]